MSSYHNPAAPLAYSAELLFASVAVASNTSVEVSKEVSSFLATGMQLTAEVTAQIMQQAAKGLNMIRKEGTELSQQLGQETFGLLSGGSSMSSSMVSDLSQGAKGELVHGVKEGGKLFSMAVGKTELIFERCGAAIIGKFADEDQEAMDRELAKRIGDAYQTILKQVGEISVGKDPLMIAHKESMEATKQAMKAIDAEQVVINEQLKLMEVEREKAKSSIKEQNKAIDDDLKASIAEANEMFNNTVKELTDKIRQKEKAKANLAQKHEEMQKIDTEQQAQMEQLELRREQSKQLVDVHKARVKHHVEGEIKRILSGHGLDNPNIELSEDENNRIRIHIEE